MNGASKCPSMLLMLGNHIFTCYGAPDHWGFHMNSGVDSKGQRYTVVWTKEQEMDRPRAGPTPVIGISTS